MNNQTEKLFCDFLLKMNCNLANERIKRYLYVLEGFDYQCIEQTLDQWLRNNTFKFPSENELLEKLVEQNKRIDIKTGPQTIRDMFGNKVRTCTPLANELRKILKFIFTGAITKNQVDDMIKQAEEKYGFAEEPNIPIRKTPQQCIYDAGINEYIVKRALGKIRRGSDESEEINRLAKCLLPWGHFILRVNGKNELVFVSLSNEDWKEDFQILVDYGK